MNYPFGNMINFMNQFNQFKAQMMGNNTNPNEMIQNMMNKGQISQQQYNYASRMANQIMQSSNNFK